MLFCGKKKTCYGLALILIVMFLLVYIFSAMVFYNVHLIFNFLQGFNLAPFDEEKKIIDDGP
jgi:hypothetical protein